MAVRCVERRCARYLAEIPELGHVCMAFPEGIPECILNGEDLHAERAPEQTNDFVYLKDHTPYESRLRALAKRVIGREAALTAPLDEVLAAVRGDERLWQVWTSTYPEYQNGDPDAGKPWPRR